MSTISLPAVDLFLVVLYLAIITGLGLWASRGIRTSRDYFLAGKSLPWWAAGMSLVVSDIGAKDMIGLAGDAYRYGIVMMNFDFVGCIFPVLLAAFLFMPFFWGSNVYTIPEYLGRRYNGTVRTFFAVVWSLFMLATVATILVSAAAMFEGLLGWSFWFSVGMTSLFVGIYTAFGGLRAVVVTEVFSCVILIIGATLICFLGVREVGGLSILFEKVSALTWTGEHLELLPSSSHPAYPWPAVVLGLGVVLGPAYWVGNQAIVQRTLGASSEDDARASYVFCAAIKLVFPVLLVLPGLIAIALYAGELGTPEPGWDANQVLPLLVKRLVPPGALGILMGAFIAGVLSNLESYVNSASTLLVTDLYRPFVRPHATDEECLRLGRWLVAGFLFGGALFSYQVKTRFASVFEAFQTFLSFFQGALFALLLFGMLTRRATAAGAVAGMLVGVGTSATLNAAGYLYLWTAFWSFVASSATLVGVSAFTRRKPNEELRGLVCWIR
ncbi:MAG TPA: sodium/solute symporter [Vicinamibacteria bacterium]|nr:sodium/solute symporter [Vicinamibacteria bacterium]